MCGIAGILKLDRDAVVEEARLRAMRDILVHRGPDGAGLVIEQGIGLAHRRLSIIDLVTGQQPMGNRERSTWITYNGELYNFRQLRAQLQQRGCRFTTNSDTEVVLHAYEVYGESCVEHFRGMFAFALWDGVAQKLFMARDRLGIKPFYFSMDDRELLFASEIKAILAVKAGKPEFNRAILPEFLASRYVAGEETFFRGIRKLLPAHTLSWTRQTGLQQRRYWTPGLAAMDTGLSYEDHVHDVRDSLEDAVRSHLVSDVPVGLFLSGGLDSTILAALMAPMLDGEMQTFSVGFDGGAANELSYARMAADAVGARHHEVSMGPRDFFAELPQMIWHEDEPIAFPSSIPLHCISRLAKEQVKVVLTGEGADELFIGYDYRYRVTALNARLGHWYEKMLPAGVRKAMAEGVSVLPKALRRYAERSFLALSCNPHDMFFENFSVFRSGQRQSLLLDGSLQQARDPYAEGLRHYLAAGDEILQCMSHADLQTYLVELLMKQDQMSMAASIETRVPFLDHLLVEKVLAIPACHHLRGWRTKSLLRDAVKDIVPPAILARGKMGFPVPMADWLRGDFWPLVEEFVLGLRARGRGLFDQDCIETLAHEHHAGISNNADRLWLLINLEIWQRIFIDGEAPDSIYSNSWNAAHPGCKASHPSILVLQ